MAYPSSDPFGGAARPAGRSVHSHEQETDHDAYIAADAALDARLDTAEAAWTSFTPTITAAGWALVNGTVSAAYLQVGKTVHVRVKLTWGSTSTFGAGALTMTGPVSAKADTPLHGNLLDASAGARYYAHAFMSGGGTTITILTEPAAGAIVQRGVTSTIPFTWATGDIIYFGGTFEAS